MKLAALGQFYHWPKNDLLGLSMREIDFWLAAAGGFNEQVKEAQGNT